MKKARHTEEQIAFALKKAETGTSVAEATRLASRFMNPKPDETYRRDGPIAYALFKEAAGSGDGEELHNARALRQQRAEDLMNAFLLPLVR